MTDKRSITLSGGTKTSVCLEDEFYDYLREIAKGRRITFSALVEEVRARARGKNLSSALRLYALETARAERAARADD